MSTSDTYTYCDYCKREGYDNKNYKCTRCGAIGCYREGCPNRNWTSNVWTGDTCWGCGQHDCVTPRGAATLRVVTPDPFKIAADLEAVREYRLASPPVPDQKPSFWFRMLRPLRGPTAARRVLDHPVNGITSDRFRWLLERAGCRIEGVEVPGDIVVIHFIFVEDEGVCTAVLTDRLRDGSYLRCNIFARVGVEFPLEWVNKLNQYSKFLRFYNVKNNSLFIEFSFLLIDLPDNAALANIEVFHASIMYLVSRGFVYEGMNTAPGDTKRAPKSDAQARSARRLRALLSRPNYPGKDGTPWSAQDEDHAWQVGVVHAYWHEKFNPPIQPEYRAIYLDGYKTTTDDEGLNNDYPDA